MSQSRPEQTQKNSGNRINGTSLQTRLVLFVLFIALVPLITIATRDIIQTRQALTNGAEISLKSGAAQTANSVDSFIESTLNSLGAEAQLADLLNFLNASQAERTGQVVRERTLAVLENLAKKDTVNLISYALVDPKGNVLIDSSTGRQYNEAKEAYFLQMEKSDKPVFSAVTYSDDKTTSIVFATKILAINTNEYVGSLRVKFKSTVLQDVITKSVGPTTDTSILLLDQLNIRMADTRNPDLILKSIVPLEPIDYLTAVSTRRFLDIPSEEQATNLSGFKLALDRAKDQPFFTADISPDVPGDDTIAVAYLKSQPWTVVYSRPTSVVLAEVQNQIRTNILLVLGASIIIAIITALIARSLTKPVTALALTANLIAQGDLNARANVNVTGEIGVLASAFNSMTDQLQSTLVGLEQRIADRTADLQRSTLELETIADVTREISIIRDVDTLLKVSVELIRERFKYYHVGVFLIDERDEYAILRAASSVAAEQLLGENYKLRVGQTGVVGNVTRTGHAYMTTDTAYFDNPLLPETQSEIVLPLRNYGITIGALDIQAKTPTAFGEKDVQIFQTLADQLAAAIENAQLAQKIEGSLKAMTSASHLQTQQMWQDSIDHQDHPSYEYDGVQIRTLPRNLPNDLLKQLENGKPVIVKENKEDKSSHQKSTLLVPLLVLDQVIGVVGLEQEDPNHKWTDEEIAIAQAAANRAGLTLENARLLEESQRRALKERTIFESTARIGSAINMENILQATVEELEKVLSGSEVILQFQSEHDQKPGK
jgi:GAF domain-containing protein/HAMP domain-containing protein